VPLIYERIVIRQISRSAMLGLGALLLASASTVSAQTAERPADRLSRHLRELASDPTSLSALIGAGQASLDVGDGNAALGFFARADERSPRNGQVKHGLARALLMVDNPREALKMFAEARSHGIPDVLLAPDRGLAYDLRGDTRRAQQDYALALTRGASDEVTKRYALSLGISGERDRALQLLDPLLYKRDQGAWRARAFVLAMTGDVRGASAITHQVMPQRMAQTMDQFLARLPGLNAAQKAAAVHLGEMPSNVRFAANTTQLPRAVQQPPTTVQQANIASSQVARTPPESREPRRRPGTALPLASPPPARATLTPSLSPTAASTPTPTPAPVRTAQVTTPQVATAPVAERGDLDAIMRDIRAAAAAPQASSTPARTAQAAPAARVPPPVRRAAAAPKEEPAKLDPKKGKTEVAKVEPKPAKTADAAKKKPVEPKHPQRIWVQVAGGANVGALPKEWTSVAGKAPELKAKGPWTARNRATNRLLAGPFKTQAEAQAAVAKLRKAGVGAFAWTSDEGEAVEKVGVKK
jgi:Flp pilus assembly protein TadD